MLRNAGKEVGASEPMQAGDSTGAVIRIWTRGSVRRLAELQPRSGAARIPHIGQIGSPQDYGTGGRRLNSLPTLTKNFWFKNELLQQANFVLLKVLESANALWQSVVLSSGPVRFGIWIAIARYLVVAYMRTARQRALFSFNVQPPSNDAAAVHW